MAGKEPRVVYTTVQGSTAIRNIGYNVFTNELIIEFNKRKAYPEYVFGGIPKEVASAMMRSRSKGKFYHANIKDNKSFTVKKNLGSFKLGAIVRRVRNFFSRK